MKKKSPKYHPCGKCEISFDFCRCEPVVQKTAIDLVIDSLEKYSKKVVLPWTARCNYPFYVDIQKPRPSLSKHDGKSPTYWNMEDGEYMLACVNLMPRVLEYVRKLEAGRGTV